MTECKDCLLHSMCYLLHAPHSFACREFVDRNKVVEVVRCKDCTEWDEKEQECKHWYGFHADDFCSYGERREGE